MKNNKSAATAIDVDVTPVMPKGSVCEIDARPGTAARFVKGGVIKLPSGQAPYEINFHLGGGLQFDTTNPIWCGANCPAGPTNDPQISNPRVDPTGTILTVDANPAGPKNAVHYSLGFSGGGRFDPIIVNG